ncbi:MAG: right-handed parallel beta-helix repeat-containing protein [Vicinamibacterales bacterium]
MRHRLPRVLAGLAAFGLLLTCAPDRTVSARVATTCTFATSGNVMTLDADCWTSESLIVPDGFVMDLGGNTIVGVDPSSGTFTGAIVRNVAGGTWAGVRNGTITTQGLQNACKGGDDRLRGVMLEGAGGFVTDLSIDNINKGPSGCQEGNAIEIRSEPFDGTHPATKVVEVAGNVLTNWQKTGIVVNGDVDAWVHHNVIAESATQANLAANSLQAGFGAKMRAEHNHIAGNSWGGPSEYVATAILLYQSAPGTVVRQNNLMDGNADIGIYVYADGVTVDNNKVFESGPDNNQFGYDIAVGDYGTGNAITNNKAKGYATPYDGVSGGKNKAIPAPSKQ